MMRSAAFAIGITAILAACNGQPPDQPSGGKVDDSDLQTGISPDGETLLANTPPGWKMVHATDGELVKLVEYVAPRSPAANWIEKLSFESLAGDDLPDPIDFMKALNADQAKTCRNFAAHTTFSGLENGYPTNVQILVCDFNPVLNKGQVTMLKVIRGNERFYTISRAKRVTPFEGTESGLTEAEIAAWSLHLRAISVCDTNQAAHPCP